MVLIKIESKHILQDEPNELILQNMIKSTAIIYAVRPGTDTII